MSFQIHNAANLGSISGSEACEIRPRGEIAAPGEFVSPGRHRFPANWRIDSPAEDIEELERHRRVGFDLEFYHAGRVKRIRRRRIYAENERPFDIVAALAGVLVDLYARSLEKAQVARTEIGRGFDYASYHRLADRGPHGIARAGHAHPATTVEHPPVYLGLGERDRREQERYYY